MFVCLSELSIYITITNKSDNYNEMIWLREERKCWYEISELVEYKHNRPTYY